MLSGKNRVSPSEGLGLFIPLIHFLLSLIPHIHFLSENGQGHFNSQIAVD